MKNTSSRLMWAVCDDEKRLLYSAFLSVMLDECAIGEESCLLFRDAMCKQRRIPYFHPSRNYRRLRSGYRGHEAVVRSRNFLAPAADLHAYRSFDNCPAPPNVVLHT